MKVKIIYTWAFTSKNTKKLYFLNTIRYFAITTCQGYEHLSDVSKILLMSLKFSYRSAWN